MVRPPGRRPSPSLPTACWSIDEQSRATWTASRARDYANAEVRRRTSAITERLTLLTRLVTQRCFRGVIKHRLHVRIESSPLQQAAHRHEGTDDGPPASQAGSRPRVDAIVDRLRLTCGAQISRVTHARTGPRVWYVATLHSALISFVITFVDTFRHDADRQAVSRGDY